MPLSQLTECMSGDPMVLLKPMFVRTYASRPHHDELWATRNVFYKSRISMFEPKSVPRQSCSFNYLANVMLGLYEKKQDMLSQYDVH